MPCRAHSVVDPSMGKNQIWHPFPWSKFRGSVLRKHGHECVWRDWVVRLVEHAGAAANRLDYKTGENWFSICCEKQTQFPVDTRLFPRLGVMLSRLCRLRSQDPLRLSNRSAAFLSKGLKNSFSAGSELREAAERVRVALLSLSMQPTAGSPTWTTAPR